MDQKREPDEKSISLVTILKLIKIVLQSMQQKFFQP